MHSTRVTRRKMLVRNQCCIPNTEFLCACGLQNFRPVMKPMTFYTWSRPVLVNIAHAACRQEVNGLGSRGFEASMKMVGQGLRQVDSVKSLQQAGIAVV